MQLKLIVGWIHERSMMILILGGVGEEFWGGRRGNRVGL